MRLDDGTNVCVELVRYPPRKEELNSKSWWRFANPSYATSNDVVIALGRPRDGAKSISAALGG